MPPFSTAASPKKEKGAGMTCKATIVLESDTAREAAELVRRVLGRSPVTVTQNFGSHCGEHVIDDRDLDENLVETLED